jgi:chromosomal replication initiation ATPase DnaA
VPDKEHEPSNLILHLPTCSNHSVTQDSFIQQIKKTVTVQDKEKSILNMRQTLSKFNLNDMQSAVYKTITEHSLTEKPDQLRMFVAGPRGTGKSWIIDALRKFFTIQNQSHRLRLASYTGVAS